MKLTKKELESNQLELKLEISPEEYQSFLEKTAQTMADQQKIKGFRPGKAPYDLLQKQLGGAKILEKALDSILTHFYIQALDQEKIEPLGPPRIDLEKIAPGNPLIVKAILNLIPTVDLANLEKIRVKQKKITVSDQEIEQALQQLRENQASEILVTRAAAKDDKVEVDFQVSIDGVAIEGGQSTNYPLIIGKGQMIPGFEEKLIGHSAGEKIAFKLKFPSDYPQANLSAKEADFAVTLKNVYQRSLPQVDDSWAQKILQAKNLADLKDKLTKNYQLEKQAKADQELEKEILEKVIAQSKIGELAPNLIQAETDKMIEELQHNVSHQGLKFEDYLTQIKKNLADLQKDFQVQAQKRLQASLIIRKIVRQEKIKVEETELNKQLALLQQMYAQHPQLKDNLNKEEFKNHLRLNLLNKKVMDFLKEQCLVK